MLVAWVLAAWHPAAALAQPIAPGPGALDRIQAALLDAKPGDTVELTAGVFHLERGLVLNANDVTLKGVGPLQTLLQFGEQGASAGGLAVSGNGVQVRDLALENPGSFGVRLNGCDGARIRQVRVEWLPGGEVANSVGLHAAHCTGLLLEGNAVRGASAAGVQVEQAARVILRDSVLEANGIGIVAANNKAVDVYANTLRGNTAGILVVNLPGVPQQDGGQVRVFRNQLDGNNGPFRESGYLGLVASGVGVALVAARDVEVFGNRIRDHASAAVAVLSYPLEDPDEAYSGLPAGIQVHDNRIADAAYAPDHGRWRHYLAAGGGDLAAILWDGVGDFWETLGVEDRRWRLVLSNNGDASFLDTDMAWFRRLRQLHNPSRKGERHCGEISPLPPVRLEG